MSDWKQSLRQLVADYARRAGLGQLLEPRFVPEGAGESHVEKGVGVYRYIVTERGEVTQEIVFATLDDVAIAIISQNCMRAAWRLERLTSFAKPPQYDIRRDVFSRYEELMRRCGDAPALFAQRHIAEILAIAPLGRE